MTRRHLTPEQKREIVRKLRMGLTHSSIARDAGIAASIVSRLAIKDRRERASQ